MTTTRTAASHVSALCVLALAGARPYGCVARRHPAAHGIKSTAGVVTSAAVVMVSVFAIFATLSLLIFKQLGIGLAVAVLIDATLVRGVLLPTTMKLLGDWNWYLPKWLEWLPHVGPGDGKGLPPDTSTPRPQAHLA